MERETRISRNPARCTIFMINTDDLQKSILVEPDTLRYTLFGWTEEESLAWSDYRQKCEEAYQNYTNPVTKGYTTRLIMRTLIKEIRRYDNDPRYGHHLLDKVALNGTIDDCAVFNVRRGTPRAAKPHRSSNTIPEHTPHLTIATIDLGMHILKVRHPQTPESKALPEGIVFIKIFRYIGTEAPAKLSDYDMIGNAQRAKFISLFGDLHLQTDKKVFAWYYGRYESKKGLMGPCGPVVKAPVYTDYD